MKKKKSDLEGLLNSLIEKGWKPFGDRKIIDAKTAEWNINLLDEEVNKVSKFKDKVAFSNGVLIFDEINLRELVSKESGLWQFVCENNLQKQLYPRWENRNSVTEKNYIFDCDDITYRLIESALCDEDKLEEFLLNSIIVEG